MIELLKGIGDFFVKIGDFFASLFEQVTNSISAISQGWEFLNNSFLATAPEPIITFLLGVFTIGLFLLISAIIRGR